MIGIPEATAIILTTAERCELEGLVRSTKTEHRLRQRARIVLLAAEGMASRAMGGAVGCTSAQHRSGECVPAGGKWKGELDLRHFGSGTPIPFLIDWFRIDDPRTEEPMNVATVGRDLSV